MNWDDDEDFDDDPAEPDDTFCRPCPNCGTDVYEDCEMCPVCGEFITASTHPLADKPGWYVVIGLLGIAAVILAMMCT